MSQQEELPRYHGDIRQEKYHGAFKAGNMQASPSVICGLDFLLCSDGSVYTFFSRTSVVVDLICFRFGITLVFDGCSWANSHVTWSFIKLCVWEENVHLVYMTQTRLTGYKNVSRFYNVAHMLSHTSRQLMQRGRTRPGCFPISIVCRCTVKSHITLLLCTQYTADNEHTRSKIVASHQERIMCEPTTEILKYILSKSKNTEMSKAPCWQRFLFWKSTSEWHFVRTRYFFFFEYLIS